MFGRDSLFRVFAAATLVLPFTSSCKSQVNFLKVNPQLCWGGY